MKQFDPEITPFSVVIVAAGSGTRMSADIPKQYLPLCGKPVLRHSIDIFLNCTGLKQITIVIDPTHQELYEIATKGLDLPSPVHGGETRQKSVANALATLNLEDNEYVLIHDAARPCIQKKQILELVKALKTYKAATLAAPITETIRTKDSDFLGGVIDRETLLSLQTPQGFHFGVLKSAHEKHQNSYFTDDTSLVAQDGIQVAIIQSDKTNLKITTAEDLDMAAFLLEKASCSPIIKTAIGFDVHAFGERASSLRIGGIDIPHTHKLEGHSDADVVLHAITDALYGTIGDGDIGSHFPPNDPSHKGKDSAYFLKEAQNSVQEKGGIITHIDTTIICETPKITPHRESMRQRISEIMELPISRISIKATTTEKLGFTGRGEGIAAQSIVTISIQERI
ncbi:MAG: bifunctional 2-C-methyl-D-erythritol 4-phosphate cytidylyltransferase/2-C-methyl-D-erythritol 2,4-cyclodiphosphate synthase [Alphaproteobacteria bacterium]|nr:bifunctional 2-C-methyl-D-erythritol 4-phosphate cytidylyltransferase/2-C-methyl-D-erythritol 2,4-cyclodiphosphate synthase [Alphaproteobacteria bacterium]MCB1551505.1 bifunctional 2-C-methyl-D-erythritol 4-phosphate cytidylyltransferase/2-C-methyl-D-erythritol 2,4-cyclodiphosphate synthase [Alphaproteobacteria bacterium]MCB9984841.1 bifunctional 2-C-methyl-D-erythritol 4-phosphate cytidylyltransferase/2-C-methyl-D-erythritol 2,4-cyclodiphosphate synthase [Micavibrio sp.]HRK97233.1 bifunction